MFKQKQLIFLQKQRRTWKKNFEERHSHLSMQHENFNITSLEEIPWVLSVDIHLAVSLYCDKHQQMCVSSAHDTVFWQVSHNPLENGREISLNKPSFAFVPGDIAQSYKKESPPSISHASNTTLQSILNPLSLRRKHVSMRKDSLNCSSQPWIRRPNMCFKCLSIIV